MNEKLAMPEQEAQTAAYLKTNGPQEGAFDMSPEEELLLFGKTDFEKAVLRSSIKGTKQNAWMIQQIIGLKGAHRVIHNRLAEGDGRFARIDATLDVFTKLRDKWLTRKKVVRNVLLGIFTLFLLPFLSLFMVEVVKRLLHWN
jgi:hypothetical protein